MDFDSDGTASSAFVVSLDFELFWGVADVRSVASYGRNVEGEWEAIPRLLDVFRRYRIRATWATVGMLMCRDYRHWTETRPSTLPQYQNERRSTYRLGHTPRDHPRLFFARPLVERIIDEPGQELATHTYSHFYCDERGATPEAFVADLECAREVAADLGIKFKTLVFPRNQARSEFVEVLPAAGIRTFRGNRDHWLYRHGERVADPAALRAMRRADAWVPLSGVQPVRPTIAGGVANVPASHFLRPWIPALNAFETAKLKRIKTLMTRAAELNASFHLWWHPHNFGTNLDRNIGFLEQVLKHYRFLNESYGMRSCTMSEAASMLPPA